MKELVKKAQALKTAKEIGCSGAHKMPDGNWMPCQSHDELIRISDIAETQKWRSVVPGGSKKALRQVGKKKKKKKRQDSWSIVKARSSKEWEDLGEGLIYGFDSLPGGGIISGDLFAGKAASGPCWPGYKQIGMKKGKGGKMVPNCVPIDAKSLEDECCPEEKEEKGAGPCWPGYKQIGMKKGKNGKMVPNCVPINVKSAKGPEYVRDNDPDVFIDPDSARTRARQLGCIGISRRVSKTGRSVWMPCTNMTDYANRAGTTALGKRNIEKRRNEETRRAVRTILRAKDKATLRRKISLFEQLRTK